MKVQAIGGKPVIVGGKALKAPSYEDAIIERTISGAYENANITQIQSYALAYCTKLTSVSFPNVTVIGNMGLDNCTKLESVYAPKAEKIGTYGLRNSLIASVSFPVMTRILAYAFSGCKNLVALILGASTVCTLDNVTALRDTPIASGTGYVYVPSSLVDGYKAATNWSTYAAQIRAIEDYPDITGG